MCSKKPLILLVGPTAVGKTELSINIAKKLNCEIISADSMQIYKYMDIGTAKITKEEMNGIRHHLIDEIEPDKEFTVANFQKLAFKYIDEILSKGKLPMIVGGTGLYINSIIYNLDFTKAVSNWGLRQKYEFLANKYGNIFIYKELEKIDPISAKRIHVNDRKRIIRALEIYHETGKPMSKYYNDFRKPNEKLDFALVGLTMNRKKLYDRINKRVEMMIEKGLIDEVKKILDMGYKENSIALQGLGYKEIIKYLKGEWDLDKALYILKRDTRRFAKRQLTWFRREDKIKWIDVEQFNNKNQIEEYIIKYVKEKLKTNRIFNDIIHGGD